MILLGDQTSILGSQIILQLKIFNSMLLLDIVGVVILELDAIKLSIPLPMRRQKVDRPIIHNLNISHIREREFVRPEEGGAVQRRVFGQIEAPIPRLIK